MERASSLAALGLGLEDVVAEALPVSFSCLLLAPIAAALSAEDCSLVDVLVVFVTVAVVAVTDVRVEVRVLRRVVDEAVLVVNEVVVRVEVADVCVCEELVRVLVTQT